MLIVFLLAACSGNKSSNTKVPEGRTEIVMWNLFGGGDAEYMQEIVDAFNESQDKYFITNVFQEYEEYYTKLLTSIASGKGPDLAIAHSYVIPELVAEGLVTPIDKYASEIGLKWEEFNQNVLEAVIFEDKHYAVPIDTHPEIMFINNKLVREAGLLNDDGTVMMEETPEGFVEFLTKLKEKLPEGKMPFAFSNVGEDPYRIWWALYNQLGGEHIVEGDLEHPKYVLDTEKAIQAAKYIYDLYHTHKVIPLNLADFYSDFQTGNAAVMATGVWATGIWEKTDGLEFTPMPFPNMFGQKAAWASSHTFVLPFYSNADEEVLKGAVEFMKFATDNGAMWAKAGHIPAKDTVVESKEFKELPYRSDYAQVADYVKVVDKTVHARGIQDIMIRNLDRIWTNEATPEEAFKTIEQEVTELISN
ncbi:Sugar transporter sugar binding protein [Geobacillus thermodenitrificans NG80-2]|uniref:Sugar transporter sugar binding protein n=1 Tax=Geobacillus thermodenitrificans (strain NG80-2) TaxID=420246 RepID=A4IKD2_GEOTN|nr:Sugar transporter sugar binding protein [Geobacillus thermodenitrificans NG80-2]